MIAVALLALFMMGLCIAFGAYAVRLPRYTFKRLALVIHLFAGSPLFSTSPLLTARFSLTKTGNCLLSACTSSVIDNRSKRAKSDKCFTSAPAEFSSWVCSEFEFCKYSVTCILLLYTIQYSTVLKYIQ